MAIRLTEIKVDGKLVRGEKQLNAAEAIEGILKEKGITAEITISRWYADRWYSLESIRDILKQKK